MMYGFGDEQVPFTESVDLLEDLVVEYITEMVRRGRPIVMLCVKGRTNDVPILKKLPTHLMD